MANEERVPVVPKASALDANFAAWRQDLLGQVLRIVALAGMPMVGFGVVYLYSHQNYVVIPLVLLVYAAVLVAALGKALSYFNRVLIFLGGILLLGGVDLISYGWGENARIYLMAFVIFSAIFIGQRGGFVALGLSSALLLIAILLFNIIDAVPLIPVDYEFGLVGLLTGVGLFALFGFALVASLNYLLPRIVAAMERSERTARELEQEKAVLSERTRSLQQSNMAFQRRAMYLDASLQVSQILATLFEVEPLLEQAANLITRHFGFYHTGIFLMDESGEWAELRAASSSGGRKMLSRGHRLRRGSDSMVGWVTQQRQPRITADVGEDATYFANPDLSDTHSAMTLPLMMAGRLLGVLDVQSTEQAAFDADDIRTLQGLAGQLAVAINNARRLSEEAAVLEAASPLYRLARRLASTRSEEEIYAVMGETLQDYSPTRAFIFQDVARTPYVAAEIRGESLVLHDRQKAPEDLMYLSSLVTFAFDLDTPLLISNMDALPDFVDAAFEERLGTLIQSIESRSLALVPIRVESELLGLLLVSYNTLHRFTPLERQLYRVLADLCGVALERIKLVQDAQTRLNRERWIRQFADQMMRIPDLQTMVVEAAEALQDVVQAEGVVVSLTAPEMSRESQ